MAGKTRTLKRPSGSIKPSKTHIDYEGALNVAQLEAVTIFDGPVLVLAGAGSGKTRVITFRTAYLAEHGVDPAKIVLLTFTRRAAREMLARAQGLSGIDLDGVQGGTFHSFANRLLRCHGRLVGLDPGFSVIDQADSEDAVKFVRDQLQIGQGERRFPKKSVVFSVICTARNKELPIEEVVEEEVPQFVELVPDIERIAQGYEQYKRAHHLADYDDLLFHLRDLLLSPHGNRLSARFEYVMADEYQDTNGVQADIIQLLGQVHNNVFVVGDDSQCIYTWRGSRFENVLEFEKLFPRTKVIRLEQNYRSTQQILDVANAVMSKAERGYTKVLEAVKGAGERPAFTEFATVEEQARYIAARVLELREEGVELRDMAVLCRAVWHLRELEIELNRCDIPYVVFGGIKFAEAAHVKDVMAFLRAAVNPQDALALKRILELLPGIGPTSSARLIEAMAASADAPPVLRDPPGRIPKTTRTTLGILADLLVSLEGMKPATAIQKVNGFYHPLLRELYDDAARREPDLEQLVGLAAPYGSVEGFLTDMVLEPNRDKSQTGVAERESEDEFLCLSTVHSAKGLEFHAVFVPHAVDGLFPSSRSVGDPEALEEERRLMYVAVTRDKAELTFCQPVYMEQAVLRDAGAGGMSRPCRFLDDDVMELVDRVDVSWSS